MKPPPSPQGGSSSHLQGLSTGSSGSEEGLKGRLGLKQTAPALASGNSNLPQKRIQAGGQAGLKVTERNRVWGQCRRKSGVRTGPGPRGRACIWSILVLTGDISRESESVGDRVDFGEAGQ